MKYNKWLGLFYMTPFVLLIVAMFFVVKGDTKLIITGGMFLNVLIAFSLFVVGVYKLFTSKQ